MKEREIYAGLRTIAPFFVRVDGRNFRRVLSSLKCERPYDLIFAKSMSAAAEMLMRDSGLPVRLIFVFSDEINALFCEAPFRGRIEKLDSIVASFMASALTLQLSLSSPVAFDARIISVRESDIPLYLAWRQGEAWRNHVNAYGYYSLRKNGDGAREAHAKLRGMDSSEIHELVYAHGINLAKTPSWQRRGVLVHKEFYEKQGYNVKTGQAATAQRTKAVQKWDVPLFASPEGKKLIAKLTNEDTNKYK